MIDYVLMHEVAKLYEMSERILPSYRSTYETSTYVTVFTDSSMESLWGKKIHDSSGYVRRESSHLESIGEDVTLHRN